MDATTALPVVGAFVFVASPTRKPLGVVSDDRGRFVFQNLPAGDYRLSAKRIGYLDALYDMGPWVDVGPSTPLPPPRGHVISLKPGEWRRDLRLLAGRPGAVIGRVHDGYGSPVVGLHIRAFLLNASPPLGPGVMLADTAVTDDRGVYSLDRLPRGRYVIAATAEDVDAAQGATHDGLAYPPRFFPDSPNVSGASEILVDWGAEVQSIDFNLTGQLSQPVHGRVEGLEPGTGHSLRLRLSAPRSDPSLHVAQTWVKADHTFEFPAVPPGDYILHVSSPFEEQPPIGYLLGGPRSWERGSKGPKNEEASARFWGQIEIVVRDQAVQQLVVPVVATGALRGRVVMSHEAATGTRLPQNLTLTPSSVMTPGRTRAGRVQADGAFEIANVPPGAYLLRAIGGSVVQSVVRNGVDHTFSPMDYGAGDASAEVVVTVTQGAAVTGRVNGSATRNTRVVVFPANREHWPSALGSPSYGSYLLREDHTFDSGQTLAPGRYYVIALEQLETAWPTPERFAALAPQATSVELKAGDSRFVDLVLKLVPVSR